MPGGGVSLEAVNPELGGGQRLQSEGQKSSASWVRTGLKLFWMPHRVGVLRRFLGSQWRV